jgi:hypothetical protein
VSLSAPVGAQQPSAEALTAARELVSVVSNSTSVELVANLTRQAWPQLEASLRSRNPKIDAATLVELRTQFERLHIVAVREALNDAIPVYARHFTAEEMRAISAFYRTPAGMKAMAVMPRITTELFASMGPQVQGLRAKMTLAFLEILKRKQLLP